MTRRIDWATLAVAGLVLLVWLIDLARGVLFGRDEEVAEL